MQNRAKNNEGGYVALMATIVISLVLLVLISQEAFVGWYTRFIVLGTEAKEQASALAEGCADQAMTRVITDVTGSWQQNGVDLIMPDGEGTCHIDGVQFNTNASGHAIATIKTQSVVRGSYANLGLQQDFQELQVQGAVSPQFGTIIVQTVVNNNGTNKNPSDTSATVSGTNANSSNGTCTGSQCTFAGSAAGVVVSVSPGTFSVSTAPLSGFSQAMSGQCTGTVGGGEVRTCTISYTTVTTTLTLIANVTNLYGIVNNAPADFPLMIDGTGATLGTAYAVTPGSHTVSATTLSGYTASAWGYDCAGSNSITLNTGDHKICIINFADNPPPAPICADTVMMLDRTGSMTSSDLSEEKNAANAFVSLYAGVLPPLSPPRLGVGSFGGLDGSRASVPTLGQLTTSYSNILSQITTMTNSNSGVGTDLQAAITVGSAELTSHGIAGKQKVLILVSDGDPSQPSGATPFDTGFSSPSSNSQNASGDAWTNPANAYTDADSGADATDIVSGTNRHRFFNFGFGGGAGLPSGATVKGVEVQLDAWNTSSGGGNTSANLAPTAAGISTDWTQNSGSITSAITTSDTLYIVPTPQQQTFVFAGAAVPAGSTITSVTLHVFAQGTGSTIQLMAENGSTQMFDPSVKTLTSSYVDYSYTFPNMPGGGAWSLSEVNAWTTRFGVQNNSGASARVDRMYVVVNYTTAVGGNTVIKAPGSVMGSPNNQWSNPTNAFTSNDVYTTDSTNGHVQGFNNFGLSVPAGASITGIQVTTEAKLTGTGPTGSTGTLFSVGQGTDTAWNGNETDIDETTTPSCSSTDSIIDNVSNHRESIDIDLSSVPNGATITSVDVSSYDKADSSSGGTYRTYIRLNGTITDASTNLTAGATGGTSTCNPVKTQNIPAGNVAKSSGTSLEVGVVKVSGNSNAVRVGALRASVNYVNPPAGSVSVALSSNGTTWTSGKSVTLDSIESVDIPSGNSTTDLWGRSWGVADFGSSFALRVTNSPTGGTSVSLDHITAQVFYTTVTSGTSANLAPTATGISSDWAASSGTATAAVGASDSIYIAPTRQQQTYVFAGAAIPAGATINSVTLHVFALGSGSSLQLMAENGSTQIFDPSVKTLTSSYVDYSYTFPTMPNGAAWTLAEVNAWTTRFGVQNNSGASARVDRMYIVVGYTLPPACQIGVDLSWNGGTSWSSEKVQTLNGTSTAYVLGSASDDWSGTHTWTPTEFSNSNFRARVHAINPGGSCTPSAVEHLDHLQVKVHYTQTVDPTQAALNAADAAKLSGTNIFTIYFGNGNPGLLAQLATGSTTVSGHQPGSFSDPNGVSNGDTGLKAPSAQAADTGGDGNGFESNPVRAFVDDNQAAANIDGAGDRHRYYGYNFVIPPNATITGVVVQPNWWLDSTAGTNSLSAELSWNGGANWTSAKSDTVESTASSHTATLGSSSDTWGHAWTQSDFDAVNFRVRVTSNSTVSTRDFFLDYLPVRVYYSVNTENADGDNFFISPAAADMKGIFQFIGNQVCPAASNPAQTPPPTQGGILVVTQVINNEPVNAGTSTPTDFTMSVSNATNVSPSTPFAGNAAGVVVTVNPGTYSINASAKNGYTQSMTPTCSSSDNGDIAAGEARVCIVTYDDVPPPPPPPNLNVTPGTWQETPTSSP